MFSFNQSNNLFVNIKNRMLSLMIHAGYVAEKKIHKSATGNLLNRIAIILWKELDFFPLKIFIFYTDKHDNYVHL